MFNNEENFIKVDNLEIRYWVIKVIVLQRRTRFIGTNERDSYFAHFLTSYCFKKDLAECGFKKKSTTALDVCW
jgi:hypothetical protein